MRGGSWSRTLIAPDLLVEDEVDAKVAVILDALLPWVTIATITVLGSWVLRCVRLVHGIDIVHRDGWSG